MAIVRLRCIYVSRRVPRYTGEGFPIPFWSHLYGWGHRKEGAPKGEKRKRGGTEGKLETLYA